MKTRHCETPILLFRLLLTCLTLQLFFLTTVLAQHRVTGQDSAYPLYSKIDTLQWKKYKAVFNFEKFNLNHIFELRKTLQPYLQSQDPLCEFLYAASMDLYPYGYGKPKEAQVAITYYTKAADQGLALAEKLLFDVYRYGLMEQGRDEQKAISYLKRMIQHGDAAHKAKGYADLATLLDSGEFSSISLNKDSVLFYLDQSLQYNSKDTWVLDYAAELYEEKSEYEKAITYLLRSDNENSHLKVAEWLMEGKQTKKDVNRALQIVYQTADALIKIYGRNLNGYMGSNNPIHVLNNWYRCKKWITREQLGKYVDTNWICD